MIQIEDLYFAYDKELILEDISLTIKKQDFLAIIGPNGGGKSTLLKLILGIHKSHKGNIHIETNPAKKEYTSIGYVPQNTNININFPIKVIEVVLIGYKEKKKSYFGYSTSEIKAAIVALTQVGMEEFAQHKIASLSGGQRQRVMIARALCAKPTMLILDEPTSSIDVQGQKEIYRLLKHLNQTMTIIVVSHDISVILEYANKVAHINKRLSFHDISNKENTFHTHGNDTHFCEVELLQMLGSESCDTCEPHTPQWKVKP